MNGFFRDLGEHIESRWAERDFNEGAFANIAQRALEELPPHKHLKPADLIEHVLSGAPLPEQFDLPGSFGQPPITLFVGTGFYIDALFWVDGTTSVHQHGFEGAFQVLSGSSIHSRYRFDLDEQINSRMKLGRLHLEGVELLTRGQTREIHAGSRFIHALFHLDRPSVTIVVRTIGNPQAQPQWSHRKPGVAVDPFRKLPPRLMRRLQVLKLVERTQSPSEYLRALETLLIEGDAETTFYVLQEAFDHVADAKNLEKLWVRATKRHGARIDRFRAVFEQSRRENAIINRRRSALDPEQRYFLAILLNLSDRAQIMKLVSARFPRRDSTDTVVGWIGGLWNTHFLGADRSPFGLEDFWFNKRTGIRWSPAVEKLVRAALADRAAPTEKEARAVHRTLLESAILRPLFNRAKGR